MNVIISGALGFMGRQVAELSKAAPEIEKIYGIDVNANGTEDYECVKSFDEADFDADVIIDFSSHLATKALIDYSVRKNIPLVLATTGQTAEELKYIEEGAKKIPLFFASNYSLGISLLIESAKKIAAVMNTADIEIVETHHNRKIDAPSGTAKTIAEEICSVRPELYSVKGHAGKRDKNEIGIHSVRMANNVGIHEVIIGTDKEAVTIKHEAYTRAVFAEGALSAAKFLVNKRAGLYGMKDMLK